MGTAHSTEKEKPLTVSIDSLSHNNPNTLYKITDDSWIVGKAGIKAKNLTYLMKLILLTKEEPKLLYDIVDHIKDNPAELHKRCSKRWTPLMISIANSNSNSNSNTGNSTSSTTIDTVKKLLELGANPNSTTLHIMSPLMVATYCKNLEAVKLLCDHKDIKINQFHNYIFKSSGESKMMTALSYAISAINPDINIINYLIKLGARVSYEEDIQIMILQNIYIIDNLNIKKPTN